MKQGFWKLTHQGIAVDEDGFLVDGQNRLEAVVASECCVPMVIITGVPRKAMVAADYVSTRSVADSAKILGKGFEKNETAWGATARRMMVGMKYTGASTFTHQEIIDFIGEHREALEFSFEVLSQNKRGLCGAELRAIIARAWYKRNCRSRIRLFCQYLMDGMVDNKDTDSAVIKLRNWLMDMQARGQTGGSQMRDITYAKIEEALTLFIAGEPCERLGQVKAEQFPLKSDDEEGL